MCGAGGNGGGAQSLLGESGWDWAECGGLKGLRGCCLPLLSPQEC